MASSAGEKQSRELTLWVKIADSKSSALKIDAGSCDDVADFIPVIQQKLSPSPLDAVSLAQIFLRDSKGVRIEPDIPPSALKVGNSLRAPVLVDITSWEDDADIRAKKRAKVVAIRQEITFGVEECDLSQWETANTVVATAGLSELMKNCGGFPQDYFVRLEEMKLFEAVKHYWWKTDTASNNSNNKGLQQFQIEKLVLVGSPGVGKSTFLVLLAFYLARVHAQQILLFRRLKEVTGGPFAYAVISHDSYYADSLDNVSDIITIRKMLKAKNSSLWYFIDGFRQVEVNANPAALETFHLLATSSQYDIKSDDPVMPLLLPGWREADLKDFGIRTNLFGQDSKAAKRETKRRFYVSGGSLRDFLKEDVRREVVVQSALKNVTPGDHAAQLISGFYSSKRSNQVDRIARHYVEDPQNPSHYWHPKYWKCLIDSPFALRCLLDKAAEEEYKKMLNMAKGFGGAFYGWSFEYSLHKLAITQGKGFGMIIRDWKTKGSYEEGVIHIDGGSGSCQGRSEDECLEYLQESWAVNANGRYWYPDFPKFPDIACIAKCRWAGRQCIAYIQITVGTTHKLNLERLLKLDKTFASAGHIDRLYVALVPDRSRCEDFHLSPQLDQTNMPIRLYVGYVNEGTHNKFTG